MSTFITGFIPGNYRLQGMLYYDSVYAANTWVISQTDKEDRIHMPRDVTNWMRYGYIAEYRDDDPSRLNLLNYIRMGSADEITFGTDKSSLLDFIYDNNIAYVYIYYQNMWYRMQTMFTFRDKSLEYKKQVLRKFEEVPLEKVYSNGITVDIFSRVE
jgi:hypothetical protein